MIWAIAVAEAEVFLFQFVVQCAPDFQALGSATVSIIFGFSSLDADVCL